MWLIASLCTEQRNLLYLSQIPTDYEPLEIYFSPDGGVDIEEVAEKTPDRIRKYPVDIKAGLSDATADEVAEFLGFEGDLKSQCSEQVKRLYKMFLEVKGYFQKSSWIYIVAPNFVFRVRGVIL